MDMLKRLKRAKTYFDEYRRKPGADVDRADKQAKLAQTLYDEEQKKREQRKQMEESFEEDDGEWK